MLGTLGWQELLLIGLILALLLGASRVSEMGRGLGAAVREFRRGVREPDTPSADDDSPLAAQASQVPVSGGDAPEETQSE